MLVRPAADGVGQTHLPLRLPELRRGRRQVGRPLRGLRRMEHHRRGSGHPAPRARRQGAAAPAGRSPSSAWPARPRRRRAPPPASTSWTGCWAAGWSPASAVLVGGDPGIGKSTLLLQAAAALARAGRRVLYISGEEFDRADAAARAPAGRDRRAGGTRRRGQPARHHRGAGARAGRRTGGDRFDPDHVAGQHRERARHRRPGARRRVRADPPGQGRRLRPGAGRPRHQGRRASPGRACWSTWSTRCCISKATAAISSASCAP